VHLHSLLLLKLPAGRQSDRSDRLHGPAGSQTTIAPHLAAIQVHPKKGTDTSSLGGR